MRIAALFFFLPLFAFADGSLEPRWRALLHFDGSRSNIDPKSSFFLSPDGFSDPEKELEATKKYFAENPIEAPCRFPARAIHLGAARARGQSPLCERWDRWREAIGAKGIELVFAAAFINSPSSMYGHTLLKFPRGGKTEGEELLDYTLNYGANTGDAGGLRYVWLGLTGGFTGLYSTAPFYLKVKEYNFVENRDFWIYRLNTTKEELDLLVAHAWELREVGFPYYFLRKNCSYYLLEFLEVARPTQNLTEGFPFWAVPVDTIRRLKKFGWIEEARYRPSRYKKLKQRQENLHKGESELVEQLLESSTELPKGREAFLLDTAYELWRYRSENKPGDRAVENRLLQSRAAHGASDYLPDFSAEKPPEEGHSSERIGLGYGRNDNKDFAEISYRGTLHDLLAQPHGYESHSELSMGDIRFRFERSRIFLERLDILRLRSFSPRESWFPKVAWSFRVGALRAKEFTCSDWRCLYGGMSGGAGFAWALGPLSFFTLAELDGEAGGVFDPDYRISLGPEAGLFLPVSSTTRALIEGGARVRLLGEKRQRRYLRAGVSQEISRNAELRISGEWIRNYRDGVLGIFFYF